ncbi:MAG: four helix bundle suffix domain-containing protein [Candidatus Limisoma sp.]
MTNTFLPKKGNFRNLIVYRKAECIYDITYYFAHTYLSKGDRTIDQMVQSARSGKQNIAEGSVAASTSAETEIKLINVARASLNELLLDYEDFLRARNLTLWDVDSEKAKKTRKVCLAHSETHFYIDAIKVRTPETIANIAITLIHQADVLLRKLLEKLQQDFLQNGGIKEQMYRARINNRK